MIGPAEIDKALNKEAAGWLANSDKLCAKARPISLAIAPSFQVGVNRKKEVDKRV